MRDTFCVGRLINKISPAIADFLMFYIALALPLLMLVALGRFALDFPAFTVSVLAAGVIACTIIRRI